MFHVAEATRTTPNGDLEVLEIDKEQTFVRKTYAAGHWIDADVSIALSDGREAWI